jgi:hypothetical protein
MLVPQRHHIALALSLSGLLLFCFILVPRQGFNAEPAAAPQAAGHWCQCVEYVQNRFALNRWGGPHFIGAADMGPYLEAQGLQRIAEPVEGAVIVFPRTFGMGIDAVYGHVGVVTQVSTTYGSAAWALTVRGARQQGKEWAEHGCSNVSDMYAIIVPGDGSSGVSFYATEPPPGRLRVVEPLHLSTTAPRTGELVYARFTVENSGGQPLQIEALTAGGRQGNTWDAAVQVDFPLAHEIMLQPGERYTYKAARALTETGGYFAEPAAQIDGAWSSIASANRVRYSVQGSVPLPRTAPRLAETPALTPTAALSPTLAPTAAPTETPSPSAAPTETPSPSAAPTETPSPSAAPTETPSPSAAPTETPSPSAAPTETPELLSQWSRREHLAPGTYRLRVWGGPGLRIYLDGELVLDGLQPDAPRQAIRSDVSGGPHEIAVQMYADNDGSTARYAWEQQP